MTWMPDYCSADDLKDYVRIFDAADDVQIGLAVTAASRAVDRACNRQFGLVAAVEPRSYTPRYDRNRCRWVVSTDDLMTVSGLVVEVDGLTVTDFSYKPANAAVIGRPWTELVLNDTATGDEDSVTVTARWGWTEIPDPIVQATLLQASRFFTRRDSPYGIAGSPDNGSELRLLAKVDPDVAVILGPYMRVWGAA